ncbi:MAG: leucine-rich repeat domain-containing protein [Lachnospiraceae bacterium]|nr:leucine-rich repeat domain-containing protein [Lachnospiraceae bacterium]MDY4969715.1 leucine-rich repeat domain-containing protein [Lachnospiraceae bacterium]
MQMEEDEIFIWEEVQGGVRIKGCTCSPRILTVPGQIAGLPVVQIGDYAFQGMDGLCEAHLPRSLEFLGDHVFFNCVSLRKLTAYDKLTHVGDGAFKNCDQLSEIQLSARHGHASSLRLLISDVMQDVRADIIYEEKGTEPVRARLMFPAFYFDYIENYPARIFEEVIYGSGQAYRQCFRGGDVDYEAYDRLFERSAREDTPQAVLGHAVGRLSCPYRLSDGRRQTYEKWLASHGMEFLKECIRQDAPEDLEKMLELDLYDEEQTGQMISRALQEKKPEFVSLLMAYQGRRFAGGRKRKKYEL